MTVLVTGGAGYIGAHVVRALAAAGHEVLVVDDLSTGRRERVDRTPLVLLDIAAPGAAEILAGVLRERSVDAVVHLAARKRVDESVRQPLTYYRENLGGLLNVLGAMRTATVRRLVFSSSAAVYGDADSGSVDEESPLAPVSPYGETKLAGEWLCRDVAAVGGIDVVALRYFNVAGAGRRELGDPSVMNLVTIVIERLQRGEPPVVFGDDYRTADGSCVRDFVHVADVADAHVRALEALSSGELSGFEAFNVGTGTGCSVKQVVARLMEISGAAVHPVVAGRRPGDPASVVARVDRIAGRLGWRAAATLEDILSSAWLAAEFARTP